MVWITGVPTTLGYGVMGLRTLKTGTLSVINQGVQAIASPAPSSEPPKELPKPPEPKLPADAVYLSDGYDTEEYLEMKAMYEKAKGKKRN
jgi:hypothetical protein